MPTRTAAQRRKDAKHAYDAYLACCPSRQLLDALTDKWVCLIVSALGDGPMRHAELARRIAGVSQKMLTQTLRTLARDGFVTRTVVPAVPVRVDYRLTPLGEDLQSLLCLLKAWAEKHMDQVLAARRRYDAEESRFEAAPRS